MTSAGHNELRIQDFIELSGPWMNLLEFCRCHIQSDFCCRGYIWLLVMLEFLQKGTTDEAPLAHVMAQCLTGRKPSSQPMRAQQWYLEAKLSLLIEAYWRHMVIQIWVNTGSANDLLPDGIKPLPERTHLALCRTPKNITCTWTNVDWSSVKSSDIHNRAIS